jgi:hypothetical protein
MEAVAATAAPAEAQDARALAGDREAFNALYRPHFEAVYDFVLRIVRERELAPTSCARPSRARGTHFPSRETTWRRGSF